MDIFKKINCKCGKNFLETAMTECLQEFENGTIHVRASCPFCHGYIKYQSYSGSKMVSNIVKFAYYQKPEAVEDSIIRYDNAE